MHINLRCGKCGDASLVSFAKLYGLWKAGYDGMCAEHKKYVRVNTDVKCHCGHTDVYDGLMFRYAFQLVFDEIIRKEAA